MIDNKIHVISVKMLIEEFKKDIPSIYIITDANEIYKYSSKFNNYKIKKISAVDNKLYLSVWDTSLPLDKKITKSGLHFLTDNSIKIEYSDSHHYFEARKYLQLTPQNTLKVVFWSEKDWINILTNTNI